LSSADGPSVPPDSGADTDTAEPDTAAARPTAPAVEPEPEPTDEVRLAMRAAVAESLGDAVLGSRIIDAGEVIIRVATPAWAEVAKIARHKLRCGYFCFLNGIDWLPSPFGRYEDSPLDAPRQPASTDIVTGVGGGDTRFQVFARVVDIERHVGITFKADVPDDDLSVDTWIHTYAGANWHERETHEMLGINFRGHPNLVKLYLPGHFEGHPLRKDFPLLARQVKPWPGIVDVEPMPGEAGGDQTASDAAAPSEEAAT
jgi:NADH-quinone oxidoreductase subunit C